MRMSRNRIYGGLLGAALLVVVASQATAQPRDDESWLRVETPGATIFSNAGVERTWEISDNLNTLLAILNRWMGPLGVTPPVPTSVYVFRDDASFRPYKEGLQGDPANVAGFFLSHPHGNFLAINGDRRIDPARVVYHEVLHYFARYHLPDIPLWFNEGLAELYSGFRVEEESALLGLPHERHLRLLRSKPLEPLDEIFAVTTGSETYNERSRRGPFYAQSWALVHYLVANGGERGDQMVDFLARLSGGEDVEDAFEQAFDARLGTLEKELEDYIARPDFPVIKIPLKALPAVGGTMTALPRPEALVELGNLLIHTSPRLPQRAADHFETALALDPSNSRAYAGLGMVKDQLGSHDDAEGFYAKALELGPASHLSYYLAGRNVLLSFGARGGDGVRRDADFGERLVGAIAAFRRSLELDPGFPEAWVGLGTAWSYHPEPEEEGVEALERALVLAPGRVDVLYNLAVLHARLGQGDKAWSTLDRRLVPLVEKKLVQGKLSYEKQDEVLTQARRAIGAAEASHARALAEAGELEDSERILEALLQRPTDSDVLAAAEELLDRLRAARP